MFAASPHGSPWSNRHEASRTAKFCRVRRRVGQDDDWRLEPFGGVDRHDAHGVDGCRRVSLDLGIPAIEPGEEAVERTDLAALELERGAEQLVDRIARRLPQSLQQAAGRNFSWVRDVTLSNSTWGNRHLHVFDPRAGVHAMGGGIGQGPRAIPVA